MEMEVHWIGYSSTVTNLLLCLGEAKAIAEAEKAHLSRTPSREFYSEKEEKSYFTSLAGEQNWKAGAKKQVSFDAVIAECAFATTVPLAFRHMFGS